MKRLSQALVLLASACVSAVAGAAVCSVSALNLLFGPYDTFRLAHSDTTGTITATCTGKPGELVSFSIAVNAGGSGNFAQRRLRSPFGTTLSYNLYLTASRTIVWGDGNSGTSLLTDAFALQSGHTTRSYPVYGRIYAAQNARVAAYTDAIVVTLNF